MFLCLIMSNDLLARFKDNVKRQNLFLPKDRLMIAVSGGVDSVVLCELCRQAGYGFMIAHCNFQLRGEESERDEVFVRNLAEKHKVEVKVKRFDTEKYAEENKMSIQEAARDLRYQWFEELVHEFSLNKPEVGLATPGSTLRTYLLTAHHADDNIETVLMNFFRGTGLQGLTGVPTVNKYICRPLLPFTKNELIGFAKENNLEFVEDSSNSSSKYTRNLFRNELIPAIGKVYPEVNKNLLDNIGRFKEIEKLYKVAVGDIKKKLLKKKGNEWHIPVKQLMGYGNRALIYEIINDFGFTERQIDEVIKLADSESGKFIDSRGSNYRIIRHRHWFIISAISSPVQGIFIIEDGINDMEFGMGRIKLERVTDHQSSIPKSSKIACLDTKDIKFPLILRKWKTGDYFYPLGMKKKKKLSRFFIDQKLSKAEKDNMWVLEMNKKIIWVVGNRIDERFKITEKTRSVLKISLANSSG